MKVAVIGAGFAGLATGWFLLNRGCQVDIFDPLEIGEATSGVSAGLLTQYTGKDADLNWLGDEGMRATKELLKLSSETLCAPVIHSKGILRPALSPKQKEAFFHSSLNNQDVIWLTPEACKVKVPGVTNAPGIYIPSALTVNCKAYLFGLWKACEKIGAKHIKKRIKTPEDFASYDTAVLCVGAFSERIPWVGNLPIITHKGQTLTLQWPKNLPHLPMSIYSEKHLSMDISGHFCHVGSTHEVEFTDDQPDIEKAKADIMPDIYAVFPPLRKADIFDCFVGFRSFTTNKKPLITQVTDKCWLFTGLGMRGLLYHALFAEKLVNSILR